MDQGLRKVTAAAILVGGVGLALVFRQQPPEAETRIPGAGAHDQLLLRAHPDSVDEPGTPSPTRSTGAPSASSTPVATPPASPPTVVASQLPQEISRPWATSKPVDPGDPPPRLERSFPEASRPAVPSAPPPASTVRKPPSRTHKVVDGDKLPALAKRYLGSADRFREIYEANRAVLNSPDLLPIGVELVIPPREPAPADRTAPPASTPGPQPTLVPVESLPDES